MVAPFSTTSYPRGKERATVSNQFRKMLPWKEEEGGGVQRSSLGEGQEKKGKKERCCLVSVPSLFILLD